MKLLTEVQIEENYNNFIELIKSEFEGERQENLLKMYKYFDIRIATAPASAKLHYHYAFPGGYLLHVNHVYEASKKVARTFVELGGTLDFTKEELAFAAIHHDLGKVGDLEHDYYSPQDNEWRRKNMNEVFKLNDKIQYMDVTDRTIYLLNHFDVKYTQKEFLGIKLSDGLYSSGNEPYLKSYSEGMSLKTPMPYIIHWADHISTQAEYCEYKESVKEETENWTKKMSTIRDSKPLPSKTEKETAILKEDFKDIFKED